MTFTINANWVPRLALAWAPGSMKRSRRPKTVDRSSIVPAGVAHFVTRPWSTGRLPDSEPFVHRWEIRHAPVYLALAILKDAQRGEVVCVGFGIARGNTRQYQQVHFGQPNAPRSRRKVSIRYVIRHALPVQSSTPDFGLPANREFETAKQDPATRQINSGFRVIIGRTRVHDSFASVPMLRE